MYPATDNYVLRKQPSYLYSLANAGMETILSLVHRSILLLIFPHGERSILLDKLDCKNVRRPSCHMPPLHALED